MGEIKSFRENIFTLINNAATPSIDLLKDVSNQKIDEIVNLNIVANIHLTRFFLNCIKSEEEAVIINISGAGAGWKINDAGRSLYFASKAWLMSFTEALASENNNSGVVHYAIAPNGVDTKLRQEIQLAQEKINNNKRIRTTDLNENTIAKVVECIALLITKSQSIYLVRQ